VQLVKTKWGENSLEIPSVNRRGKTETVLGEVVRGKKKPVGQLTEQREGEQKKLREKMF